jgi:hypothetical protein
MPTDGALSAAGQSCGEEEGKGRFQNNFEEKRHMAGGETCVI